MAKKFLRTSLTLIVITLLITACAGNSSTPEKHPLIVGWSLYPGWYPLLIAEKLGYFEKNGVEVNLRFYANYKDTTAPLASGYVDAGTLVLGDALLDDIAKGVKVVLITDSSNGADQFVALPGISGKEGIRGKRIGVTAGTFGGLLVREMLAIYDLNIADVKIVEVPPEQVPNALTQNYIDIGHTFEPYASEARANGNKAIFTSADAPDLIMNVIAFRKDVLAAHPQDVRNFINAWFEAAAYWQANPEDGSKIIASATGQDFTKINFEGVKFFDRDENLAAFQPGSDRSSIVYGIETDLKYLTNIGLVTNPVAVNEVLDASYLK
jgi:NitT/TauT family transport system substrate-binding protein